MENTSGYDADGYLQMLWEDLETDTEIRYTLNKKWTVQWGGNPWQAMGIIGNYEGVDIYQTYYTRVVDGVVCSVLVTVVNPDHVATVEAMFK